MYLAVLLSKFRESSKSLVSYLIHSYSLLIRSAEGQTLLQLRSILEPNFSNINFSEINAFVKA